MEKEITEYMKSLFCKDVLSIIQLYNPKGFDKWNVLIKECNKQYYNLLFLNDIGGLSSKLTNYTMFSYRDPVNRPYPMIFYNNLSSGISINTHLPIPLRIRF